MNDGRRVKVDLCAERGEFTPQKTLFFSSYGMAGGQVLIKAPIEARWEAGIEHCYRREPLWIGRECSTYLCEVLD